MIATAERQGIADQATRLTREDLEALFIGAVSGLLSDRDRLQVERALRECDSERRGRES